MLLLPFQCLWCACCVFTRFAVVSSCFLSLGEKMLWKEELGIRSIQTPAQTLHCNASNSKYLVDLSNKTKMLLWFSLTNFTAESTNQSSRKSYLLAPGLATFGPRLPSGFEAVCLPPHPLYDILLMHVSDLYCQNPSAEFQTCGLLGQPSLFSVFSGDCPSGTVL